jgi:hypothetical protein
MEITFARLYEDLPRFDEIFGFLADRAYRLVAVYDHHRNNRILRWTGVMFASPEIARAAEDKSGLLQKHAYFLQSRLQNRLTHRKG